MGIDFLLFYALLFVLFFVFVFWGGREGGLLSEKNVEIIFCVVVFLFRLLFFCFWRELGGDSHGEREVGEADHVVDDSMQEYLFRGEKDTKINNKKLNKNK